MPAACKVVGAILAGGAGARLGGVDKGLQLVAGKPLIEHVARTIGDQVDELMIVANRNADAYARYAVVIADAQAGHAGPLAGLAAALERAGAGCLLSVPVDCPQPPRLLRARLQQALDQRTMARCAVAFDGTRRQPLFALYRPGLWKSANDALLEDSPVWRWQQSLGGIDVDFADCAGTFVNLNTVEDFARYEHDHDHA